MTRRAVRFQWPIARTSKRRVRWTTTSCAMCGRTAQHPVGETPLQCPNKRCRMPWIWGWRGGGRFGADEAAE